MIDYRLLTAVLGSTIAAVVLLLVRRDHLYVRQATFWLAFAVIVVILGFMPDLIHKLGSHFKISYPPTLLLILACLVLFLKSLLADIAITRIERRLRRLTQQIALQETLQNKENNS
jgi:hypothetical protein